jgi:hypothetical protein
MGKRIYLINGIIGVLFGVGLILYLLITDFGDFLPYIVSILISLVFGTYELRKYRVSGQLPEDSGSILKPSKKSDKFFTKLIIILSVIALIPLAVSIFLNLGIVPMTPELCVQLNPDSLSKQISCITKIHSADRTQADSTPEGCESYNYTPSRDMCYSNLALKETNISLCDKITKENVNEYDKCRQLVATKAANPEYCSGISNLGYRNQCYLTTAKITDNTSVCGYLTSSFDIDQTSQREMCVWSIRCPKGLYSIKSAMSSEDIILHYPWSINADSGDIEVLIENGIQFGNQKDDVKIIHIQYSLDSGQTQTITALHGNTTMPPFIQRQITGSGTGAISGKKECDNYTATISIQLERGGQTIIASFNVTGFYH